MNKKGQIEILLMIVGGMILFYFAMQDTSPFNGGNEWTPICGNNQCEAGNEIDEFLSCPTDCGIICGDGECVIDPYDERIYCAQDCSLTGYCGDGVCNNNEDSNNCQQDCYIAPSFTLKGGMRIEHEREGYFASCTSGLVVKRNNKDYLLTAGHCVTKGSDGMPDYPDDIGLLAKYQDQIIGYVYTFDNTGGIDAALISIEPNIQRQAYTLVNGDMIYGFTNPVESMEVYKIGISTGLTYGIITDINIFYIDKYGEETKGFEVKGNNGDFSISGDSGSAIITVSIPHKVVGIISAGSGSNWGNDIKDVLNID